MTRSRPRPLAAAAALVVAFVGLAGCTGAAPDPNGAGRAGIPADCPTSQPPPLAAGQTRTVTIATSKGTIAIRVEGSLSPVAAGNVVALASCGYYDGVVFHRVVPGFVIQGGDGQFGRAPNVVPTRVGSGGPGYTIADEPVTTTYGRGVVAMARTSKAHSQGGQFFIVLSDEARSSLESANTYAIFGHVIAGMDVADAIAAAADAEIPSNPIAMDRVTVSTP
ncbi:MAG TPA: peptidylprolyl isomerase [Candidatus Limnocylindrales bacterium]|nr:peptidylprolyl isomerase [Candidatus Limnocylindrales bacterium]